MESQYLLMPALGIFVNNSQSFLNPGNYIFPLFKNNNFMFDEMFLNLG